MTSPTIRVAVLALLVVLVMPLVSVPAGAQTTANEPASVGNAPDVAMGDHTIDPSSDSDITVKYHVSYGTGSSYSIQLINLTSNKQIASKTLTNPSTSKQSTTITVPQGTVNKRTFVAVVIGGGTTSNSENAFNFSCIGIDTGTSCPEVTSTSVTKADGSSLSGVSLDTSLESFGQLKLNVTSSGDGTPRDLSDDGVTTDTELKIEVTVDNYNPVGLFGTANVSERDDGTFNWTTSTSGSTTTLTIYTRPVEVQRNESIDVRTPGSWPTDLKPATAKYDARVRLTAFDPPGTLPGGLTESDLQNATVLSDAQEYTPPQAKTNPPRINFTVASPHFETDGSTNNTGFYKAYLPDGYLDFIGVNNPTTLAGTYQGQRKKLTVTEVPGGLKVDANINYSSGSLSLVSDQTGTTGMTAAISYRNTETITKGGGTDNTLVEVVFNESLGDGLGGTAAPAKGDFEIVVANGSTIPARGLIDRPKGDSQVIIDAGGVHPRNVTAVNITPSAGFTDLAGNTINPTAVPNKSITTTSTTVGEGKANQTAYRGENIAVVGDTRDESVYILRSDRSFVFDGSTESDSNVTVAKTKTGSTVDGYWFLFNGNTTPSIGQYSNDTHLDLRDLGLGATVSDASITTDDALTGAVTANAGSRTVKVTLTDPSDDTRTQWLTLNGTGGATFDFGTPSEAGNYSVEVEDLGTGNTVSTREVNVTKAGTARVRFAGPSVIGDERGDVVNITVEPQNSDFATLTIGDPQDNNYALNVTVEDASGDGEVLLQWNTFLAGGSTITDDVSVFDSDDNVDVNNLNTGPSSSGASGNLIDDGDYTVSARGGEDNNPLAPGNGAQAVATVSLTERSTNGVRIWTAVGQRISDNDITSKRDVYQNIANGNISQDRSIGGSDALILQIQASGLEGPIEAQSASTNDTTKFMDFVDIAANGTSTSALASREANNWADLRLNQTDAGSNQDQKIINISNGTVTVIPDPNNDTWFVVAKIDNQFTERDTNNDGRLGPTEIGGSSPRLSDGEAYLANFTVNDEDATNLASVTDGLANNDQNVYANFNYQTAEAAVDLQGNDELLLQAAADRTITGTTTVATRTQLTVRVQSAESGTTFLKTTTTRVAAGSGARNTWSARVDMSDVPVGTNFTVDVTRSGSSLLDSKAEGRTVGRPTASVTFGDQTSNGQVVVVRSATLSRGGFVAIHRGSAAGEILGTSEVLSAGTTEDVRIALDQAVSDDVTLVAMAHRDTDDDNVFDFPDADGPYVTGAGAPVTDSAAITYRAGAVTVTPIETPTPAVVTRTPAETPTPAQETVERTAVTTRVRTVQVTPTQTPGFGIAVALVALLAAALLAARRPD